jgi:hypothetical protein
MSLRVALLVAASALIGPALGLPADADAAPRRDRAMVVTLLTVPRVAGMTVTQGARTYATDRRGRVRLRVGRLQGGRRTAEGFRFATPRVHDKVVRPGVVATFARFGRRASRTRITVGVVFHYRVLTTFSDAAGRSIPSARVDRIVMRSHLGTAIVGSGGDPLMLQGSRIAQARDSPRIGEYGPYGALRSEVIGYSVLAVVVDGSNVVNRGQIRFFPFRTPKLNIPVLFYDVTIRTVDALFGTEIGDRITIVRPDGHELVRALGRDGTVRLRRMPRGRYHVRSDTGGLGNARALTLSRPQLVEVKIVSYIDLLLLTVAGGALAAALVLIRRPRLRRRFRNALMPRAAPPGPSHPSGGI